MPSDANTAPRLTPLKAGAYAPILTIFDAKTEDLDLETQRRHAVRLVKGGLAGLVALGSNGEAVHQTREERISLISAIRAALDEAGFEETPLIAGCTDQSVRGSILMCKDAAAAGACAALILPPSYYKGMMSMENIISFYADVADASPIPIMMYNYPGAVAGVDLDSDSMIKVAQHPNVKGAKFTCANVGKLTRLAAATNAISIRSNGSGFLCTAGFADITIQTAVSGGSGTIVGTGNVLPKLCAKVWSLWAAGKQDEAVEMQKLLSEADWILSKGGIGGTKAALQELFGYGGVPRKPLPAYTAEQAKALANSLAEACSVEKSL